MKKIQQEIPTPELLSEIESLQIFGGSQSDTMGSNLFCPNTNCDSANCEANCGVKCICPAKTIASCDDYIPPQPNTAGQCL